MRLITCALVLAAGCWGAIPVWIDTDPSVAPGAHEIDDGIALLQAFHSPEIAIRGVSIVFGNADLPAADRIGREIVTKFGPRGLPVYTGAAGANGISLETAAVRALTAALKREPLVILALGPATNVAAAVKRHPELAGRILEVVAVAGRRPGQRFTAQPPDGPAFRDFNFEMDPDAFQILLDSNVKLTFAPWEVSSKVWLTRADIEALAAKDAGMKWIEPAALDWLEMWRTKFGTSGFNPFDALAVGRVVDRPTIQCSEMSMRIERGPDDTGAGGDKPYLVVREPAKGRRVTYCHTPLPEFKVQLLRRLGAAR